MTNYKRGDIVWADLGYNTGSEQNGERPVLIAQNDVGNLHSPTVIVACIHGHKKKKPLPTHVEINGMPNNKTNTIMFEQLRTIDKCRIMKYIRHLDGAVFDKALRISIGLEEI